MNISTIGLDRLGTLTSFLCVLHCIAVAFIPATLTILGLGALLGHSVEWGLTIAAASLAFLAAVVGWTRHRRLDVSSLLIGFSLLLLVSRLIEELGGDLTGLILGVAAGTGLIIAHIWNLFALQSVRFERAAHR